MQIKDEHLYLFWEDSKSRISYSNKKQLNALNI